MGVNEKTNPINLSINIPESQIEKPVVFKWLYIGDEIPANSIIVKMDWDKSAVLCLVPYEAVEKTAIDTPLTEKEVPEDVWDKSTDSYNVYKPQQVSLNCKISDCVFNLKGRCKHKNPRHTFNERIYDFDHKFSVTCWDFEIKENTK